MQPYAITFIDGLTKTLDRLDGFSELRQILGMEPPAAEIQVAPEDLDMIVNVILGFEVKNLIDLENPQTLAILVNIANWALVRSPTISPIQIRNTNSPRGYGVFAVQRIEPATVICNYGGIKMSHNVYLANHVPGSDYLLETGIGDAVIDGKTCFSLGEAGRWFNGEPDPLIWNSRANAVPNCEFYYDAGIGTMYVFALPNSNIQAGDELLADYGKYYNWAALGYTKREVQTHRRKNVPQKRMKPANSQSLQF